MGSERLRRRGSLRNNIRLIKRSGSIVNLLKKRREGEDETEERWDVHPLQEELSVEEVERLARTCIRQLQEIPYAKRKNIPGLTDVDSSIRKILSKLEVENQALSQFQHSPELRESIKSLEDTMLLLSRKFEKIKKSKYFVASKYGKKILILNSRLNASENELFLSLSRKMIMNSMDGGRKSAAVRMNNDDDDDDEEEEEEEEGKSDVEEMKEEDDMNAPDYYWDPGQVELQSSKRSKNRWDKVAQFTRRLSSSSIKNLLKEPQKEENESGQEVMAPTVFRPESSTDFISAERFAKNDDIESINEDAVADLDDASNIRSRSDSASSEGDAKALYRLGKAFLFNDGNELDQDDRQAVVYFCKAAEMGFVPAMIMLGKLYEKGTGVDVANLQLVHHFFSAAAHLEDPAGIGALGDFQLRHLEELCKGKPRAENERLVKESIEKLSNAASMGDPQSNCRLGEIYMRGEPAYGIAQDVEAAKAFFAVAVKAGHARAQNNLAVLLLQSPESKSQGVELLKVSAAKGFGKAINNLGKHYEDASASDKTLLPLAVKNYVKAASLGVPHAAFNLGRVYFQQSQAQETQGMNCKVFKEQAENLFVRAMSQDVVDAHFYLGVINYTASTCCTHPAERQSKVQSAVFHLAQILQARSKLVCPEFYRQAAFLLANIYYKHKVFQKAFALYRYMADHEHDAEAMNALGIMYENGTFSSLGAPDYDKASKEFAAAHELGFEQASFNLALLYVKGCGVEKSKQEASRLLKCILRTSHSASLLKNAQLVLGTL